MKFKVGDRVKLISDKGSTYGFGIGDICKITKIGNISGFYQIRINNGKTEGFVNEKMIKLLEYTYEDLNKTPIGTKIKFENGETLLKDGAGLFESDGYIRTIEELKKFETRLLGKIVKIEEPTYTTVYEYKPEKILDEVEKRYLKNIIRPFKDSVSVIRRLYSPTKDKDYIQIQYKDDRATNLPYFKKDTMYKGMEVNRIYTLEELGL